MCSALWRVATTLCLLLLLSPSVQAQQRGYVPEDYYSLRTVGDVAVSPDGTLVAFTVTTVLEGENRRHREVWLQPLEAGRPVGEAYRVTSPTEESSGPRFSPDGSLLAFSSTRGEDSNRIWFLRLGAAGGEAFHIDGVDGVPLWSPDGSRIAYTRAPEATEEQADRAGWIAPDAISSTLDPDRFDGRVITSIRYKRDGTSGLRPHPSTDAKAQLFVVPAQGGAPMQVTSVAFDVDDVTWAADSQRLYFTGDEREDDEDNADPTQDLWVVSAAGGGARPVTREPGSEFSPSVSPDGASIAYRVTRQRGGETDVLVSALDADGNVTGEPFNVTETWHLDPGAPIWSPDGTALSWTSRIGGDVHRFQVAARGGPVEQVTRGARQLRGVSLSRDHTLMAYAATDAVRPTEVFVSAPDGTEEIRATALNDEWVEELELREAERLTWTVEDGTVIEGWVIKPVGFEEGRSYPMVLKIHGGPHSAYGNTFFPTFHVLSAAGFFVLYTNPRGSAGYGHEFEYATRGAWGLVDREDFLTGVDAAIARYPEVDERRIGVSGGSYGGFMSNWLTATTDRFSASVTSRSISNWESWWGTSDVPGLTEFEFGGTPMEQRDLYRRLSPISYVENVTAPTLIIHSEEDYRTPMQDAEQWFLALKRLGVPTELVRYPRSSHGLSRTGEPWLLVDRLERIRSWFATFLIERADVVTASR